MRSMTGFGRADVEYNGDTISVELSSVNHRFLDCSVRMPSAWSAMDSIVKETVREYLSRGKVNVTINRRRGVGAQQQTILFDANTARQYMVASKQLAEMLGSMESLSLNVLAQLDGVFRQEEPEEDLEKVRELLGKILAEAIAGLNAMRTTEGAALTQELTYRVSLMRDALATIERRLPELNDVYEQRLRTRINELKGDTALTEERIAMEIAFMADKGDVTEEVVRLKTHFDHATELFARDDSVGRELTFLAQELQREVNTLGSKIRDSEVTKEVLRMKSELERLREQVQNIE